MLKQVLGSRSKGLAMATSDPSFQILTKDGLARSGILRYNRGQLQTPALLLYTRRGSPLYLTPDMAGELGQAGQNLLVDVTKL